MPTRQGTPHSCCIQEPFWVRKNKQKSFYRGSVTEDELANIPHTIITKRKEERKKKRERRKKKKLKHFKEANTKAKLFNSMQQSFKQEEKN